MMKKLFILCFLIYTSMNLFAQNSEYEQSRFFEEAGGFSFIPPAKWQAIEIPGFVYKGFTEQKNNNASAYISFAMEIFDGPLNKFIDLVIKQFSDITDVNFKLLQRDSFITLKGLKGEKTIVNFTLQGHTLRQYHYYFSGNNNKIFAAICTVSAEAGNIYDEIFDKSIKTLEWEENITERRFIEEAGKFLLIPSGSWQVEKFPKDKYKTIILGNKDAYINFEITSNTRGGTDVKLNKDLVENIIKDMSGKNVKIDIIDKDFANELKSLNSDTKGVFIIAEFSTGPKPYDQHFGVLDGIIMGADDSVSLDYREQYRGFSDGQFKDITTLRTLWVIKYE